MEMKRGKLGPFWGCSKWRYTKCKGSRDLTPEEKAAAPSPPPAPGPVKHWRRPDALYRGVNGSAGEDWAAREIPLENYIKTERAELVTLTKEQLLTALQEAWNAGQYFGVDPVSCVVPMSDAPTFDTRERDCNGIADKFFGR